MILFVPTMKIRLTKIQFRFRQTPIVVAKRSETLTLVPNLSLGVYTARFTAVAAPTTTSGKLGSGVEVYA